MRRGSEQIEKEMPREVKEEDGDRERKRCRRLSITF